jgi:L-fucose mutarotase
MTILKGIPSIITPELLLVIASMGHSDELVLADANFPSETIAKHTIHGKAIRYDSSTINQLLDALLHLFPLDSPETSGSQQSGVAVMEMMDSHKDAGWTYPPVCWSLYYETFSKHDALVDKLDLVERFAFYERSKKAYAVISTGVCIRDLKGDLMDKG